MAALTEIETTGPTAPFYLAGPTASGKTGVAIELAGRWRAEIVNADAFQAYEGLDILTAKPSPAELAAIPHHLFGVVPAGESFDVARYEAMARMSISSLQARGVRPLVVGGSGLYLKSLTHGLSPLPTGDPELRATLETRDLEDLAAELRERDPEGAAVVNLRNRRYVTRALEITILAGRPMSEIKNEWESMAPAFEGAVIVRNREDLYERINRRTSILLESGAIEEVQTSAGLSGTATKAIGIAEIRALSRGEISRERCLELISQATRRYAKRQMNWFRRETGFRPVEVVPGETASETADRIAAIFPG